MSNNYKYLVVQKLSLCNRCRRFDSRWAITYRMRSLPDVGSVDDWYCDACWNSTNIMLNSPSRGSIWHPFNGTRILNVAKIITVWEKEENVTKKRKIN